MATLLAWPPLASLTTTTTTITSAVLGGLVLYHVLSTARQWWRLRHIPGPWLASVSSLWIFRVLARAEHAPFAALGDKYGHLVRVGPNLLFTDEPEVLRRMSGVRSGYGKDEMYAASLKHTVYDNMFTTTNVERHDELKARLMGAYSGRETDGMEPIVDTFVTDLIHHLRGKISSSVSSSSSSFSGVVIDLAPVSLFFTMDVITRLAFGAELGFLRTGSDVHGIVAQMRGALKVASFPLCVPWIRDVVLSWPLSRLLRPHPTDKSGFGVALRFCEEAVKKRCAQDECNEKDLLGACVRLGFPQGQIASEMFFAMAAGSDTTASMMRNTMLHLMTSPLHYRTLKDTVSRAIADGRVSAPITQDEARNLPFIQALIQEGLRTRPPAPLLFMKTVPAGGDIIAGHFVPGGTAVGQNLFPLMRDRELWGADAGVFRPERWLEAGDEERAAMERLVDLCFGSGRFGCAGRALAWMEMGKVFFELFRYFDFQLVNPVKPWDSKYSAIFWETNFFVQITEAKF